MSAVSLGENARRVRDGDALGHCRFDIDIVDAIAEIGDQLEIGAGGFDHRLVDAVVDGGHENVGRLHRLDQGLLRHLLVGEIEPGIEEFAHARLDAVRQAARHHHERFFSDCHADLPET